MFSIDTLANLERHMEWADALVWRSVLAFEPAAEDEELHDKLHHLHATQRAFLQIWRRQPIAIPRRTELTDAAALYGWAKPYYDELRAWLQTLEGASLVDPVSIPWARQAAESIGREAAPVTLGDTIFQVTSHTTYHRGQVNKRMKLLGGEPPLTDYIAWVWYGRPDADWPAAPSPVVG